jgi:hypothetical protein
MAESDEERASRIDREAEAAWKRLKDNEQWADWRYLATGFSEGRRWAMHRAGANRPEGKGYARAFSEWMGPRPWTQEVDKPTRAALLWYADNTPAVEAWLTTIALNQRQKWNHPHTLRKHFEAAHRPVAGDGKPSAGLTPMQKANESIARLEEENTKLKRDLAHRDSGSLFDLVHDTADAIITVIAGAPIGPEKMRKIGEGLVKKAKEKDKRQRAKPAG